MNRRHFATFAVWGLVASLGFMGCGQTTAPTSTAAENSEAATPAESVELTVSVAASVQDAMTAVQAAYQAEAPNVTITYNFGSSGSLAQQIVQGAPVDVFLSASPQWMDDLARKGQILNESRQDLLQNSLVLIVPQDKTDLADFRALATDPVRKIAVGEPESVPAGRYAQEALTAMNLLDAVQPKLVFGKDVRQVLSYVETGNVDAGLVYATDVLISDQVKAIATAPSETHSPIIYPIAVVTDSAHAEAAQAFIDFLTTDTAMTVFKEYGFDVAE